MVQNSADLNAVRSAFDKAANSGLPSLDRMAVTADTLAADNQRLFAKSTKPKVEHSLLRQVADIFRHAFHLIINFLNSLVEFFANMFGAKSSNGSAPKID